MQNSTTSSSTSTSNDEDLKKEMFKGIVDLFTSVSKFLLKSDFQRTLDNLDSLELKESHGVGIFSKKSYNVGDVAIIDISKDTYYFRNRFGGELKNLLPSFLSFYTKTKYALTHALSGTRETNPLFPLIGLINHSDKI